MKKRQLNELALFAGIGGGILAGQLLDWKTICAVENNKYCRQVLFRRQKDKILPIFPIWDEIETFDGKQWKGYVDIVSGGFPCQAFSTAASGRQNKANLWPEMLRVIGQVCPRFVFAENVSEDAIVEAQGDLDNCGYKTARVSLSAKDMGANHIRKRWWLLAHANNSAQLVSSEYGEKMEKFKECSENIWKTDPRNTRMENGISNRMDRFKAVGNAQIPIVAAMAWTILINNFD